MKALMLQGIGQLELVEVPVPSVADDQILIQTRSATICTSDLADIDQNVSGIEFPVILGHEGAGTIAAVGQRVSDEFQVGQIVATHPVHPCFACEACRAGNSHLCLNMGHFGLNMSGTFAEYYVARADRVRVVDDDLDAAQVCLAEPLCVCLEALDQANLQPGGTLLILGDGPFGVMMARLAGSMGLGRTVIAGWSNFRLQHAQPAQTLNTRDCADPVQVLLEHNGGSGYDAVILAVASQAALADGLRCLRPRGRLVVFSALPGEVAVDLLTVHLKELEIVGACNDRDRFDDAVRLLAEPHWHEVVTHRFPLSAYQEAFALARSSKEHSLKIALDSFS